MVYGENSLCDPVAAGLVVEAMLGKVVATDPTKGHPANYRFFQALGKLRIGENPTEILQCDLSLERDGVVTLREAVAYADSVGDYVSRQLFVKILDSEEEHIDWLETQLDLIERIGEPKYLLSKLEE